MNQGIGDKYVVPQWLPFRLATQQREIGAFSQAKGVIDYGPARVAFRELFDDFNQNPSVFVGNELMGVANIIGLNDAAQQLAEYVLAQPLAGRIAHDQARRILGSISLPKIDEHAAIKDIKARLRDYPQDAISWVEQARFYTVLGQRKKARQAIRAALH